MGRSVNYLSDAVGIVYFDVSNMGWCDVDENGDECEPIFDEYSNDWYDFKFDLIHQLKAKLKSLEKVEGRWDNRKTIIILENGLAELGLSLYCGCASLSVRVIPETDYETQGEFAKREALGNYWIKKNWDKMLNGLDVGYKMLNRIGGFSNGESVYEVRG